MAAKWDAYYAKRMLPWDSGRPASQLVAYFCTCPKRLTTGPISSIADIAKLVNQGPLILPPENAGSQQLHSCGLCARLKPPPGGSILELGCGTGSSSIWLAQRGYQVTAIDIIQTALDDGTAAAAAAGLPAGNPTFIKHDVFDLNSLDEHFDMIYDCQVYHALVSDHEEAANKLPKLLFDQLKPGGLLFMLTGNANEPAIGPNVLTAEQLLAPLLFVGFELLLMQQTRFDSTDYYLNQLKKRPLAWWLVVQRPYA